jgi:hypothetical protein
MVMNNLGLQGLPHSSRTATTHISLPSMTGTGRTLRLSPSLIYLPLLDLIRCGFFRIINAEVTVLGRVVRVYKHKQKEATPDKDTCHRKWNSKMCRNKCKFERKLDTG